VDANGAVRVANRLDAGGGAISALFVPAEQAHRRRMMTAIECTAKAEGLIATASSMAEGPLRAQLEATSKEWLALAITARAQEDLQRVLLGHEPT
jgi:hypothetical protein